MQETHRQLSPGDSTRYYGSPIIKQGLWAMKRQINGIEYKNQSGARLYGNLEFDKGIISNHWEKTWTFDKW